MSCKTKSGLSSDNYIVIYDNFDSCEESIQNGIPRLSKIGGIPTMLILKKDPENSKFNSYESYLMGGWSFSGRWKIDEDTLSLFPLYEFYYDSIPEVTKMDVDSSYYLMQGMLNHKWIIEGDRIYEKPDSTIGNKYDKDGNIIGTIMMYGSNPNNSLRLRSKAKLK